ncbi:MAG: DUF420 domain-containing protein [Candidatus Dadabacteria bacterium]|nr:MAG: DUF420 domain-containing protein [Candidatus Dadabacteria bacterium]
MTSGFLFARRGRRSAHAIAMVAAIAASVGFLVCYLLHHWRAGVVHFAGTGWRRSFYLAVLLSHTLLAAAVPFLVGATLLAACRRDFDSHRRRAHWTLPVWLYVSASGVIVYAMLYLGA